MFFKENIGVFIQNPHFFKVKTRSVFYFLGGNIFDAIIYTLIYINSFLAFLNPL